jgi:hypothetical protein
MLTGRIRQQQQNIYKKTVTNTPKSKGSTRWLKKER